MGWKIRPLKPDFAAELTGQQISEANTEERRDLYVSVMRYGVTVIPRQRLDDRGLQEFASSLPDPVVYLTAIKGISAQCSGVIPLTNLSDVDGSVLPADDRTVEQNRANELWHTDLTFQQPRATLSMLYARRVPHEGGETEFCDTRLFWEALESEEQAVLRGHHCTHWGPYSRRKYGFVDWKPPASFAFPPVVRPMTFDHPRTGRTSLTIGSYVQQVNDLTEEQSQALLDRLIERATIPARVYAHRWSAGDLLLWDNRAMLHRARPFDLHEPRDMRAVRLYDPLHP